MSRSQTNRDSLGEKASYETLAAALKAKSAIIKNRGARFRSLRIYHDGDGYHLTKITKGQFVK
jgi:hypothetical protein